MASKIDTRTIQQRMRKDVMPARNTNKNLERNKRQKTDSAAGANKVGGESSTVAMKCLDYLLGGGKPQTPQFDASAASSASSAMHTIMDAPSKVALAAQPHGAAPLALPPPPAGAADAAALAAAAALVAPAAAAADAAAPKAAGTTIDGIIAQAKATLKKGWWGSKNKRKQRQSQKQ